MSDAPSRQQLFAQLEALAQSRGLRSPEAIIRQAESEKAAKEPKRPRDGRWWTKEPV